MDELKRRCREVVGANARNQEEELAAIDGCTNEVHLQHLLRHLATGYGAMANFKGFVEQAQAPVKLRVVK